MFHVKHIFPVLIFLLSFSAKGQGTISLEDKSFSYDQKRVARVDDFLSTHNSVMKSLSQNEQEVYYWVNVLRADPELFLKNYVLPFLNQFPEAKGSSASSLIADLKAQSELPLMAPKENLLKASRIHAVDLSKQNRISHSSSDGRSFRQRMEAAGVTTCAGENILEGKSDALKAVILLLIDEGVPDKGHRKSLLNSRFNLMGCSFVPKKDGQSYVLVQVFSCS
jgi:Cysteine-rich secretory protein family